MNIISGLEYVRKGMEDNLFNFTKDGKCSQCGECCTNLLPMSDKEIREVKRYILKHRIDEYRHLLPLTANTYDMTCPFRDNTNKKCTIYEVRPQICRSFICDNEKRARIDRKLISHTRRIVMVREEFFQKEGD
jgi:Fe-S-cluster containining protein